VFSKKASDQLSPHCFYNYYIELTEKNSLGYSPLYKQSAEELEATKKYLMKNLSKSFIVFSKAFFASLILFVCKANGGLHLCVDYQKLNAISKKNHYSLLLINETLEHLS